MGRVYYNKLIRDNIKSKIESKGEECEVRELNEEEFQQELLKKVAEEASGLSRARSREEFLAEYADLSVVLDTLKKELDISVDEIEAVMERNQEKKGGYEKRHFLHWSDDGDYKSNETPQGIKK